MIFGNILEDAEVDVEAPGDEIDVVIGDGSDSEDAIANEVEDAMCASALESAYFFNGGDEVMQAMSESAEVQALVEARKMSKKTFFRLGKNDDLTRRAHLASLVLARNRKDPLFDQLAKNRVKERMLRNKIFKKYESKAVRIAKVSQKKHLKNSKALPAIRLQ